MLVRTFRTVLTRHLPRAGLVAAGLSLLACSKHGSGSNATELGWSSDHSYVFDLKFSSSTQMLGAPVPSTLVLLSDLDVSFRVMDGGNKALIRLKTAHFVDASGREVPGTEHLAEELKQPSIVEFQHGLLVAYVEPVGADASAIGIRRYVVAALQMAQHPATKSWKSTEWDATGLADVQYDAVSGNSDAWNWQKLKYERVIAAEGRASQASVATKILPKIVSSAGTVGVDALGLVALDRREQLDVPLSATSTLSSTSELHLKRVRLDEAAGDPEWQSASAGGARLPVGEPLPLKQTSAIDEARVSGRSFSDVLSQLEALENDKESDTAAKKGPLFHALVGLFRQQPETITLAVKAIRTGTVVRDTLLDALAMASSVEAISALGQLTFAADIPAAQRVRAAGSLIRASRPTSEAMQLALRMIEDPVLREHGLLGVGSFIRQLREQGNSAAAAQGTAVLSTRLKNAASDDERQTVLLAIANSASPELYEVVLPYQDNADAGLKDAAIQAIRLMPRSEVEPRLRLLLERKSVADLTSALHALGRRDARDRLTVDKVQSLATSHGNPDVRREAVLVLMHWLDKWPNLSGVLAQIRQNDGDQRVRDVATPRSAP